ncbi:PQQ-binding-like beta-propeller repeat protein [Streptomyces sp. NPDC051172]|uniref:outer membrane protein assembly factor BamB family protein n=1 Tax=Streptomyces sp. NPDC051172 TaxID=3155796 RepID=UPI0034493FBC
MTQPPPPQQPPQQGGFGPPQPPPPQPGYGYPQAPQAPQQPNPYAQPAPPYGQPPNPYGRQAGYGYPQPPAPPYAQTGQPGGGRKGGGQTAIILAAVLAVALLVAGGVWYASSGKDDGKNTASDGASGAGASSSGGGTGGSTAEGEEKVPARTASQLLFKVPVPQVDDTTVVAGSWLTDKAYVKSGVAEINGYDRDKGSKLWTIKLPGPVCTVSTHTTDDDRTAVVFQPRMPPKGRSEGCSQVAAIDLHAGKKLWTKSLGSRGRAMTFENVTVSANTVAAGGNYGGVAFDLAGGRQLWAPKPKDSCIDAGYGGGEKLVAVLKCGSFDDPQLHIQTIDPRSGRTISEYKLATGIEYAAVVSTNPLVVAADVGHSAGDGSEISDFFSIDNKTGKLITRISAPGKDYAASCDAISELEHCTGVAVGNGRLYLPTEEHDGGKDYGRTNEIVAFDLATGKQNGQRADAGDGYTITPLRMDGGNVIAYKHPPYDKGGQVVSIDGGSFKETRLLENPAAGSVRDLEGTLSPDYSEILYSQGRLYLAGRFADKLSSPASGEKVLALALGAGG